MALGLLLVSLAAPASAQDSGPTPAIIPDFDDYVERLMAQDHPTKCDNIGQSILMAELDNDTVDVARQGACLYGDNEAFVMAGCADPLDHGDTQGEQDPKPEEAQVFCTILIQSFDDGDIEIDLADFRISNRFGATWFGADDPRQAGFASGGVTNIVLAPDEMVSGGLSFTVDILMTVPFVLSWYPSDAEDQLPVHILVDRVISLEDYGL
jgi:hypothetical protein